MPSKPASARSIICDARPIGACGKAECELTLAELFDVYEANGAHIGAIPISPQQRAQLHRGATISMVYHTPRMLQQTLGSRNGVFEVSEADNKRLVVSDVEQVKRFILLQADIARAMADPSKWTDPDAKSNDAVR